MGDNWINGKALDQGLHYLLVKSMCSFFAYKLWMSGFNGTYRRSMQVSQISVRHTWWYPSVCTVWSSKCLAYNPPTISREISHRYQNSGPSAGTVCSHVRTRTWPER